MASGLESEFVTLHEFVKAARLKLDPNIWDYLIGATETETTLRRNRAGARLRSRCARACCANVSKIDARHEILRQEDAPAGDAGAGRLAGIVRSRRRRPPSAGRRRVRRADHRQLGDAAGLEETAGRRPGRRSSSSMCAATTPGSTTCAKRAIDAGYDAFCITVDTAAYSRRERDIAKRFVKPWRTAATGQDHQAGFTWDNVKRFKDKHRSR